MGRRKDTGAVGKFLEKGDKLAKKGKYREALREYRKAEKLAPQRADIYDRLVHAHERATKSWGASDVVKSVGWVMKKQELEHPEIRMTHARLSPEWGKAAEKIAMLLVCSGDKETGIIEEISAFGEGAIYPLISALLQIKRGFKKSGKGDAPKCEIDE